MLSLLDLTILYRLHKIEQKLVMHWDEAEFKSNETKNDFLILEKIKTLKSEFEQLIEMCDKDKNTGS